MKILESLYLKNVGPFESASLPLNVTGVTQIRGCNKDSNSASANTDVNAVGKSLLVRPLSEIIFSSSPKTQKIKSRTKKDMFSDSDTEFGLSVTEKKTYTFSKKTNKKSYDYKVLVDGKNTKVRRKGYAEKKIKGIFDYSEDEFYSIYFIDSSRTSSLVMGSTAERISFFTNLFKLNNYDEVRKIFNSQLTEAKKSSAVLKEIQNQISDLDKDIESFDIESLKEQKQSLKIENKVLVKSYEKINTKKVELVNAASHKDAYKTFLLLSKELNLSGSLLDKKSQLKNSIKSQEKNIALAKKWDYYNTANKSYAEKASKLNSKLDDKYKDKGLKFIKNSLELLKDNLKSLKNTLNTYKKLEKPDFDFVQYKSLKKLKLETPDYYRDLISKLESKNENYNSIIKAFDKIHGDKCPTCQNKVDRKIIAKLKKEYRDKIKELSTTEKTLRKSLMKSKEFKQLSDNYEEYLKESKVYKESLSKTDSVKESIKNLEPKIEKLELNKTILEKLNSLEKPKKPSDKLEGSVDSKYYKKCLNCLSTLQTLESIFDELQKVNYKTLESDLSSYKKKLKKLSEKIEVSSTQLSKVVSKLDLAESNLGRLKSLKKKAKKLKDICDNIPVIEAIIEAYSNKGIKLLVIKQLAAMMEKNMNNYSSLLYAEPTKFKFEVKDERNFNILLCRKVRGVNKQEDIRTLSGAEARAFSFLLPLSILPLIPNERRLNIMVLDEPMANMGEARMQLFTESFIPKLSTIVPHLIIISTDNENYPNANVYTVVKEKGVSTLVKN